MKFQLIRILLFFVFINPALASAQIFKEENVIRLQGTGEVNVLPDQAVIRIGVATENQNAAEAIAENATKMNEVINVLKKEIKDEKNIQTSRYQLMPINEYDQEKRRNYLTGYRVTNEVSVQTDNIEGLGTLIDNVVAVGSNQVQQLSFTHSDLKSLENQALQLAILNAQDQAKMIADVAGVKLGNILEISTYTQQPGPQPVYREMAMLGDAKTSIMPGEMTLTQQINMTFALINLGNVIAE